MNCFGHCEEKAVGKHKSKNKKGAILDKGSRAEKTRKAPRGRAADAIEKLIDHPLVTELVAAGAMSAVTSIADHRLAQKAGGNSKNDSKVIKAAGRAAATAIGARLLTEIRARKPKT